MVCVKCGYIDKKECEKFNNKLCSFCLHFAPDKKEDFDKYIFEKIDWKILETFKKFNQSSGIKQKTGMEKVASKGKIVTRSPLGFNNVDGQLVKNENIAKVHSLFKTFLEKDYSLNSLAKNYGLSTNGLKKILTNRTYLGEVKFNGKLHKGTHEKLISDEIFYAVQRKLKEKLRKIK